MSIKVLSYNTSWESSEPKPDWNNPNPYEPDAKDEQAKLDAMSIPERDKVKDDWIATNPTQPAFCPIAILFDVVLPHFPPYLPSDILLPPDKLQRIASLPIAILAPPLILSLPE